MANCLGTTTLTRKSAISRAWSMALPIPSPAGVFTISAPSAAIRFRFPTLNRSGTTKATSGSIRLAASAIPMPVLPAVGSMVVPPESRSPRLSIRYLVEIRPTVARVHRAAPAHPDS